MRISFSPPAKAATLILFLLILAVIRFPQFYFRTLQPKSLGQRYALSQYVLGEKSVNKIDDDTLYAYAGYAYIQGQDPTTINFEHPPLAKYFFGLSAVLFQNSVILNLGLFATMLVLTYALTLTITRSKSLGLLAIVLLGTQPILQDHASRALLDFPQMVSLLAFFTALFSRHQSKYLIAGVCLGIFCSIKYPFPVIVLLLGLAGVWSYWEHQLKKMWQLLLAMVIVYLLTYGVFFLSHPNPIDFLKFEWYRFHWWIESRDIPRFLIFSTLFTGQFKGWWSGAVYEVAAGWSLLWPLLFLLQLAAGAFLKKMNKEVLTLFLYCQILMAMYAVGSASYARYLIPLLPFWTMLSLWTIQVITGAVRKKQLAANKTRVSRRK